jgi:hypothetical protein
MKKNLKQIKHVILGIILFSASLNLTATVEYDNEKYANYFIGNWYTVDIKAERVLFSIIRSIRMHFMPDNRFFAEADFILGVYKKWYGDYKISSDRVYLLFDNGARETMYYSKLNNSSMLCTQPDKITANFVKEERNLTTP